jgi:hypothetical protein
LNGYQKGGGKKIIDLAITKLGDFSEVIMGNYAAIIGL